MTGRVGEVENPFGVPLARLSLRQLERFLAGAGDEPLTWEAKGDGDRPLHSGTVRKAICAFANSDLGGWLILGATQGDDGWRLVGLSRPPRDLGSWASNIAREVRPTPAIDIRTWRRTPARGPVALVWVPPVSEPPAMTNDGIVYQRVSGGSVAVTDGRVLASLFSKGEAARSWAEQVAERAVIAAIGIEGRRLESVHAVFGFAATGGPKDRSSVLFSSPMIATIEEAALSLHQSGDATHPTRWLKNSPTAAMRQEAVVVRLELIDGRVIELTVAWDGSVGIAYAASGRAEKPLLQLATGDLVRRAWSAAASILGAYGASGTVHVAIATWDQSPEDVVEVARWTSVRPPNDNELASVRRELERAMGEYVLEG